MRKYLGTFLLMVFILSLSTIANATMVEYSSGEYDTPEKYRTIGSHSLNLSHGNYFIWGFDDLTYDLNDGASINIVFHDVYNWAIEENLLSVYLFDNAPSLGWDRGWDASDPNKPNWGAGGYEATLLGTWEDQDADATTNDVLFTTSDTALLSYLTNDGTFAIGIDPDCHFLGSGITVEVPVPEPATMFLFGACLASLAIFRRKFK